MYAYQIRNVLDKKSEDINVYVTPVNMLPRRVSYPLALVINLSESTEPGIHWVAVYINEKREVFILILMDSNLVTLELKHS